MGALQCPDNTLEWWLLMTSWTRDAGTIIRSTRQIATVFEIGLGKERTIGGEELCSGDRIWLVVVEPGMLGTVRNQGTDERVGFGRAREGVGRGVGGAGDVSELDIVGLDVGDPTNHAG